MKKVFVIIWLGEPFVFRSFDAAKSWLLEQVPYLSDIEIRRYTYVREVI